MLVEPKLAAPVATDSRQVLAAVGRRASRLGAATLGAALVVVYAGSAATVPAGHTGLALGLAGVGAIQLLWVFAFLRVRARRVVLTAGVGIQLALAGGWVLSRTVGLPGQGVLPVGELDVICLLDELTVAALALGALRGRSSGSSLGALGPCQLALALAAATLFVWGGGHSHATTAGASAAGIQFGTAARAEYVCHLL